MTEVSLEPIAFSDGSDENDEYECEVERHMGTEPSFLGPIRDIPVVPDLRSISS